MAIVGKFKDLAPGKMMKATVNGEDVCVANIGGKVFAVQHKCTHAGAPLSQGKLDGKIVTCPWHGSKFDLTTGKCVNGPAHKDLLAFKASIKGTDILVEA